MLKKTGEPGDKTSIAGNLGKESYNLNLADWQSVLTTNKLFLPKILTRICTGCKINSGSVAIGN